MLRIGLIWGRILLIIVSPSGTPRWYEHFVIAHRNETPHSTKPKHSRHESKTLAQITAQFKQFYACLSSRNSCTAQSDLGHLLAHPLGHTEVMGERSGKIIQQRAVICMSRTTSLSQNSSCCANATPFRFCFLSPQGNKGAFLRSAKRRENCFLFPRGGGKSLFGTIREQQQLMK